VNTLCQGEAGLRDQLSLFQVYHNFVLPHASLRQPLLMPEVPNDNGSPVDTPQPAQEGAMSIIRRAQVRDRVRKHQ
jgi:hypothetical protein